MQRDGEYAGRWLAIAASHYILTDPSRGWTLDTYCAEFPALFESLFADAPELDPTALAAAGCAESEWDRLGFDPAAGFSARAVATDCVGLGPSPRCDRRALETEIADRSFIPAARGA